MVTPCMSSSINRRQFVAGFAAGSASALLPLSVSAGEAPRALNFYHTHTGETLAVEYFSQGAMVPDALLQIDHILRDHRSGEVVEMDRGLLDILHGLQQKTSGQGRFEIISGYRSPGTNAMLASKSSSVAKKSLHRHVRARDIRLRGYDTNQLRAAARDLQMGGVGYYPASDFIHGDTGRIRFW